MVKSCLRIRHVLKAYFSVDDRTPNKELSATNLGRLLARLLDQLGKRYTERH